MKNLFRIAKSYSKQVRNNVLLYKYKRKREDLCKQIFSKSQINVVFFAVNVGMWKLDSLFTLLQKDCRYNPVIVSFLLRYNTKEYWKNVQREMKAFFSGRNYPYYDSYDFSTNTWIDINSLNPDIIIYAQQGNYNSSYEGFRIENFLDRSLFAYTPYGWITQNESSLYKGLVTAMSWKIFVSTEFDKALYAKFSQGKGENCVVTGCSFADDFKNANDPTVWGNPSRTKYHIIWAPHHSILPSDLLNYSNFLELAEPMLELADKYSDKLLIAFKPHPRLQDKLYKLDGWGVERTNSYYKEWASRPNTILASGSYASLFKFSDAMIHDCGAFTVEYLYSLKPVMYLATDEDAHRNSLNDFGKLCFEMHYKGTTIDDVERFINDVVINGNDPMRGLRESFYADYLVPPNSRSVAENMYAAFTTMGGGIIVLIPIRESNVECSNFKAAA